MLYETRFLLALVTTWCIEIPVLVVILRRIFRVDDLPIVKIIGTGALCTALTLPYLWFVLPPFFDAVYFMLVGETMVTAVETILLNRVLGLDLKKALVCSCAMNAASFILGLYLL
jgi:hypothetical protein